MTKMETAIYNKLNRLFKENKFGDIIIDMKSTGAMLTLHACRDYDSKITELDQAEYILVTGLEDAPTFSGTVNELCTSLANYDRLHQEWIEDTKKLGEYYEKYIRDGNRKYVQDKTYAEPEWMEHWDWYSDWHKDLYGYRPTHDEPRP